MLGKLETGIDIVFFGHAHRAVVNLNHHSGCQFHAGPLAPAAVFFLRNADGEQLIVAVALLDGLSEVDFYLLWGDNHVVALHHTIIIGAEYTLRKPTVCMVVGRTRGNQLAFHVVDSDADVAFEPFTFIDKVNHFHGRHVLNAKGFGMTGGQIEGSFRRKLQLRTIRQQRRVYRFLSRPVGMGENGYQSDFESKRTAAELTAALRHIGCR